MAEESAPAEILNAKGSNPDPIDLEAMSSNFRGKDYRGEMDHRLYQAAVTGDLQLLDTVLKELVDSSELLKCDAEGNTCLHLAVMAGSSVLFVKCLLSFQPILALFLNNMGRTPLILAAGSQYEEVGIYILNTITEAVEESRRNQYLCLVDINGDNAAHHALRNGHTNLALQLIKLSPAPALVEAVNKRSESLMYLACWNGHTVVFRELLRFPFSSQRAPAGKTVLMTAVLAGKTDIVKELLGFGIEDNDRFEALICAIQGNQLNIVVMLLRHDNNLGLRVNEDGRNAFSFAAEEGNVNIGRVIIKQSFPAVFSSDSNGRSALHMAVEKGHTEFVKFILRTPGLGRLVNQADDSGQTPLHLAAEHCRPTIVRALLANETEKQFAVNNDGFTALDVAYFKAKQVSESKWSEVVTLLSDALCPLTAPYEVREEAKQNLIDNIRKIANSLTRTYRQSTSTVGILITTVTFAAAFTLPGGYISDKGSTEGLPVFARKAAFQAFLISDTLAMCSSLMAAFICNMYRLSDVDFILYYADKISYLMWFSYSTMAIAFATGLYTVLAPTNLWLSIFICVLCGIVPPLSYFIVECPVLKLEHQLRGVFKINLQEEL